MPTECSQASLALRPARLLNRPMAAFVTRPRPAGLPRQTARPLPGPHVPTPSWVDPSSTDEPRRQSTLRNAG